MSTFFGTDGIRGRLGTSPFKAEDVLRIGQAIGTWIVSTYGSDSAILIVQDTRESSHWLNQTLCAGLLTSPVSVHQAGVLPTPALSHIMKKDNSFACGIVLSASHNPYYDNGIKIVTHDSGKITQAHEQQIYDLFRSQTHPRYTAFGSVQTYHNGEQAYIQSLLESFSSLDLSGKTIVLDCAHGAVYKVAPAIFSQLGATVIPINAAPNGTNINQDSGALHPATLQEMVSLYNADMGCAFDGDGDRVVVVSKYAIVKNGDDILALLSQHPRYQTQSHIVGTIMSNQGLDEYLQRSNKTLLRTPVGDRWITQKLHEHNLLLGGEQSGHIILHDLLSTGDGIATALCVLEAVMHSGNWAMETFTTFSQQLVNIPIAQKKDLKEPSIAAIIAEYQKQLASGRLHVRYSGTENYLRVMVEDREEDTAQRVCTHLAHALEKALQ